MADGCEHYRRCPHGSETCPCQDRGDPCNYEVHINVRGKLTLAESCPNLPPGATPGVIHCHAEGCDYIGDRPILFGERAGCGLARIGLRTGYAVSVFELYEDPLEWNCALSRLMASMKSANRT